MRESHRKGEKDHKKNSGSGANEKGLTVPQNYNNHGGPEQLGKRDVDQTVAAGGERKNQKENQGAARQRNAAWKRSHHLQTALIVAVC